VENARPDIVAPYNKGGHRETCQRGTRSQGWKMQDLTSWHHITKVDIARPVNAAPDRKGGQ